MRNVITKRPWLVAMSAMTIALMAVAFLAATSFTGQVQAGTVDADNDGMMTNTLTVFTNATDAHGWQTIDGLSGVMHKASWKDMVVDVSLECSLMTQTEVKSKGGNKDTSFAEAGVYVQVLASDAGPDGLFGTADDITYTMQPGGLEGVTFCRRSQELSAVFQGLFDQCIDDEGRVILSEECLEYEELNLILKTTNANAFNFVQRDLPQGNYLIEVQAMISTSTTKTNGTASATGMIGKGSAIVEEVRFAKTKS